MKRTGIIVPMTMGVTSQQADAAIQELRRRFPGVEFALITGACAAVVFEFDVGAYAPTVMFEP